MAEEFDTVWPAARISEAIQQYKHFLQLKINYEDYDSTLLSPPHLEYSVIDLAWHAHLVNRSQYAEDIALLTNGHRLAHKPILMSEVTEERRYETCFDAHQQRMEQLGEPFLSEYWPDMREASPSPEYGGFWDDFDDDGCC